MCSSICKNSAVLFTFWEFYGIIIGGSYLLDKLEFVGDKMNIEDYRTHTTAEMLMGPNSLRILEELFTKFPNSISSNSVVLDLGCGKGLTSLAIAKETGATVYANDLWISAEDNAKRFSDWGVGNQIIPVHEDANELSFDKGQFSALFSIDAYHYFATKKGFFEEKRELEKQLCANSSNRIYRIVYFLTEIGVGMQIRSK